MRLSSWLTAGARRRLRWHSKAAVPLQFRGLYRCRAGNPDSLVFEADCGDGRTYRLDLSPADVAIVVEADADRRARDRERGAPYARQTEIPMGDTGAACNLEDTTVVTGGTGDD